ncbi:hypothetical protein EDC04DRAFT_2720365 [Pisolithus marmoratus]|nr:hypothetical protein EDC04DRAFT_2720365 [Pisolithus marmoratus]
MFSPARISHSTILVTLAVWTVLPPPHDEMRSISNILDTAVGPGRSISDEHKCRCSVWLHLTLIAGTHELHSRQKTVDIGSSRILLSAVGQTLAFTHGFLRFYIHT